MPKHHRLHHQGRLGILAPGAPPPPIEGTFQHPVGERLDFRWLYLNDDPRCSPAVTWPVSSAFDDADGDTGGEAAFGGLLVVGVHVLGGGPHRFDDVVE